MSWNKVDDRESDERIEHESEEVREAVVKRLEASEKINAEVMTLSPMTARDLAYKLTQGRAKERKVKPKADMVNHPPHYTSHPSGVECIQITEHMGFNLGNALKYIWRADLKGSAVEDLEKAIFYINRELEKRKSK
jgi:hypothetical protein